MLKLFEREINALKRRLIILAPPGATAPESFTNVIVDNDEHRDFKQALQRFRGNIYMRDGALRRDQLSSDGRHVTPEDDQAWHLLLRDNDEDIAGCIWYLEHNDSPKFDELRVHGCPLTTQSDWKDKLRKAVTSEVSRARRERIRYAEVGGWAVACHAQCVSAALLLVLGTYSLSQLAGGALVMATATMRHSSAKILRRLGGSPFETDGTEIPSYYDERYECEMELLKFDTRRPASRYADLVDLINRNLTDVQVFATETAESRVPTGVHAGQPMWALG